MNYDIDIILGVIIILGFMSPVWVAIALKRRLRNSEGSTNNK